MGRFSAYIARRQVDIYANKIQRQIYNIQKNFNDMDFENADARNEAEYIINEMISELRSLLSELNSYRFL